MAVSPTATDRVTPRPLLRLAVRGIAKRIAMCALHVVGGSLNL